MMPERLLPCGSCICLKWGLAVSISGIYLEDFCNSHKGHVFPASWHYQHNHLAASLTVDLWNWVPTPSNRTTGKGACLHQQKSLLADSLPPKPQTGGWYRIIQACNASHSQYPPLKVEIIPIHEDPEFLV